MIEEYKDALKMQIGRVRASVKCDNYFPVAGETVRIDAETRWGQSSEWEIQDGGGETRPFAGNLVSQKDGRSILIAAGGELSQKFVARNYLTAAEVIKKVYALVPQSLPYFTVDASKEIIRADGEATRICIAPEHGYAGEHTVVVRVFRENTSTAPVFTATELASADGYEYAEFSTSKASGRGIYDVEVDVRDTASGYTMSKRINKLITVTPALCPKPADTTQGYEVVGQYSSYTSYDNGKLVWFELKLWRNVAGSGLNYAEAVLPRGNDKVYGSYDRIPVHSLPGGTTLCLKQDPLETAPYPMRFLPAGNMPSGKSSLNGSPNFTFERPLVITHDCETVFDWGWRAYGAVNLADNLCNLVLDGRGYHDTGIRFRPFGDEFVNSCFFLVNGTSDFEMFSCEIDGAGFAGISAKTDPDRNIPWYWRENGWSFKNLKIHHCTIKNTSGEGVYLGYYNSGRLGGTNSSGEEVTYHAHLMDGVRLYRCNFAHTGFDAIQINNGVDVEVCYCDIREAGVARSGGQGYAFSCTFDGKVYNCKAYDLYGAVAILAPYMSGMEVFNNVFVAAKNNALYTLAIWKSSGNEYIDKNGDGVVDELEYLIYNNVLKSSSIVGGFSTDYTFTRFFMRDNLIITENGDTEVSGMFSGSGNVFLKGDTDYDVIDGALKVADSANYNYQPNYNSPLVSAGKSILCTHDMRGYKRWYNTVCHAGPYMGIYKDTGVTDITLQFTGITINDGVAFGEEREVSVRFNYLGFPTHYRLSESPEFADAEWLAWSGDTVGFTLSAGNGEKTVYAQIKTGDVSAAVVSGKITILAGVIEFADSEAKRICVENWDKDGDGELGYAEAGAVTEIGEQFKNNAVMRSFNELRYFTGLKKLAIYAFENNTSLESIAFPDHLTTLSQHICHGCTALKEVSLPKSATSLGGGSYQGGGAFHGCTALKSISLPEGLLEVSDFSSTGLEKIVLPNSLQTLSGLDNCPNLTLVDMGTGILTIKRGTCRYTDNIKTYIIRASVPPVAEPGGWNLSSTRPEAIYVPDGSMETYKTAEYWKQYEALYKPLSEYVEV